MNEPRARRQVVAAPPRKAPAELRGIRVIVEPDPEPDVAFLDEQGLEDQRTAFEAGELAFLALRVEAVVFISDTEQTLVSPGLRGVESDLADYEIDEILDEEWRALRAVLKTVGVATDQLPLEVDREWIEWRT